MRTSAAEADANFVLTDAGGIVEVQGTAERAPFSDAQLLELLALGPARHGNLFALQRDAVEVRLMTRRLLRGAELVLATHNEGKRAEIAQLMQPHGIVVRLRRRARPPRAGRGCAGFRG